MTASEMRLHSPTVRGARRNRSAGHEIGATAPGIEADFVATQGNSADDITALRKVVFVMNGGKVFWNSAR